MGASGEGPERTDDARYVVIDGRRWRASDPAIPDPLAAELRSALMAARRAVGAALRAGTDPAPHRAAVQDAKVALGERGTPWWEEPTPTARHDRIAGAVRALTAAREPGTTCPSDVARTVGGESWRSLMPLVREVAAEMSERGEIVVTQRGEEVSAPWHGPVRLGRPEAPTTPSEP